MSKPSRRSAAPWCVLVIAFLGIAIPCIFSSRIATPEVVDERVFHYPTVLGFVQAFPTLDLGTYKSATTPLYHLLLMLAAFLVGDGLIQLRFVTALISLTGLLIAFGLLRRKCAAAGVNGTGTSLYFSLLILASAYFIGSAVRLSTDNAAFTCLLLSLFFLLPRPLTMGNRWLAALFAAAAALTRQTHAWLIGAYLMAAVFTLRSHRAERSAAGIAGLLLPALVPLVSLGALFLVWRGFVPPAFAYHLDKTMNWEVPVYVASLFGVYGVFFWGSAGSLLADRRRLWWVLAGVLGLCAVYLLLFPVSNAYYGTDLKWQRGGVLWRVAAALPNVGGTALVYWLWFPLGVFSLCIACRHLVRNGEALLVVCFLFWIVANMANFRTYQKYYEPFVLFFLGYLLCTLPFDRWYRRLGPGALVVLLLAVSVLRTF